MALAGVPAVAYPAATAPPGTVRGLDQSRDRVEGRRGGEPAPRWSIGLAAGGIAALLSLTPSVLPRSRADQAVITGLSFAAAYGASSHVERTVDRLDPVLPGGSVSAHAAIAGAALAVPLGIAAAGSRNPYALAASGIGTFVGGAAVLGATLDAASARVLSGGNGAAGANNGAAELRREHDDGFLGTGISGRTAAIAGVAALAMGAGLVLHRKMGSASALKDAAHMAVGAEPAGALIPRSTLGRQGVRFVDSVSRDPAFLKEPVRVYSGLASAASPAERAALAVAELERQGGLHRSYVLVASPTGTGWVNNVPIAAAEHFAKGDTAAVGIQYSTRASSLSMQRIGLATESNRELLTKLAARIRELHPDGGGPKVLLYGESLGAWASQRHFGARPELFEQLGVTGVLWAGKPYHSTWHAGIRPDIAVDAASIDDLARLPADRANAMKVLNFAQHDDPIRHFNFASIVAKGPRPTPYNQRHVPFVTFFQAMGDLKNALPPQPPGTYAARGHDYSAIYGELARRAFRFDDVAPEAVGQVMDKIARQDRAYDAAVKGALGALKAGAGAG